MFTNSGHCARPTTPKAKCSPTRRPFHVRSVAALTRLDELPQIYNILKAICRWLDLGHCYLSINPTVMSPVFRYDRVLPLGAGAWRPNWSDRMRKSSSTSGTSSNASLCGSENPCADYLSCLPGQIERYRHRSGKDHDKKILTRKKAEPIEDSGPAFRQVPINPDLPDRHNPKVWDAKIRKVTYSLRYRATGFF